MVDVFDVSVILHNALENALEASRGVESGYIHITSLRQKNSYFLEVETNFSGERKLCADGMLSTTKTEPGLHGMGIGNIRMVAEKYFGGIDIKMESGIFHLTVMLMLPAVN